MIDGVILIIASLSYALPMGLFKRESPLSTSESIWINVLAVLIYLLFNGYLLAKNGQTIGKKMMSIQIVDLNGHLLPLWKLICLRFLPAQLCSSVPFVGTYIAFVDIIIYIR